MYFKSEEPPSGSVNKLLLLSSIIVGCKKGKAPQLKTEKHFSIDGKKFLSFLLRVLIGEKPTSIYCPGRLTMH